MAGLYSARMKNPFAPLQARKRLTSAFVAGVLVAVLMPGSPDWVSRALVGWNLMVWSYLVLIGLMMVQADHQGLRRIAQAQAETATVVLAVVVLAALFSLVGIVVELSAAKGTDASHAWPHLAFALATVAGSWLLVPIEFALAYASVLHRMGDKPGLRFPDADPQFEPHYWDFLYFSFTIAVASQTADIAVVTPSMRRLVLWHSVLSFVFNTAILAFTINVAAGMF